MSDEQVTPTEFPPVSLLRVQEGDVLVIESVEILSIEVINRLRAKLSSVFPCNRVLVLHGGMRLSVARADALSSGRDMGDEAGQ